QIQWCLHLAMFDFDVEYIPSCENIIADAWSHYWEVFPHAQCETDFCDVPSDFEGLLSISAFASVAPAFTQPTIAPVLTADLPAESFVVLNAFDPSFLTALHSGYQSDRLFFPVLEHPDCFPDFSILPDGLILLHDKDEWCLCIPHGHLPLMDSAP